MYWAIGVSVQSKMAWDFVVCWHWTEGSVCLCADNIMLLSSEIYIQSILFKCPVLFFRRLYSQWGLQATSEALGPLHKNMKPCWIRPNDPNEAWLGKPGSMETLVENSDYHSRVLGAVGHRLSISDLWLHMRTQLLHSQCITLTPIVIV